MDLKSTYLEQSTRGTECSDISIVLIAIHRALFVYIRFATLRSDPLKLYAHGKISANQPALSANKGWPEENLEFRMSVRMRVEAFGKMQAALFKKQSKLYCSHTQLISMRFE